MVAGVCAPVGLALSVEGESSAGQIPGAGQWVAGAVRRVVQAGGGGGPQKVLHLPDGAVGPAEAPGGPPEVTHHVAVAPGAGLGPGGPAEVGRSRVPVMYGPKQVADLVGRHHHPGICPTVLNKRYAADLGQPGVAHTRPTYVGVTSSCSGHSSILHARHVQAGEGDHHVINWQLGPGREGYHYPAGLSPTWSCSSAVPWSGDTRARPACRSGRCER